ncbi:sortase domain-bontaining protein [Nocardioides sp. Bht2]|uniref:sortase domain-containing protein n=1 Tax=Nocardioides sp. Bht2 TaxID=3392297 RepID=UPI0039B4D056
MPNIEDQGLSAARRWLITAIACAVALLLPSMTTVAQADVDAGDSVWLGTKVGYGGTGAVPVYETQPADPANPGEADFWAFCLENQVTRRTNTAGVVGDMSTYLGSNYFTDPAIQGKVLWVLAHSYPAMGLAEFGVAAGAPGISRDDALEAVQYAIWRYTDLNFDAAWGWESPDSEAAYWYLVNGANASAGMTPADFAVTASLTAPAGAQSADSLVGPFVVHTNQATAQVTSSPGVALVDAAGVAIDASAVVDGQQIYIDRRGSTAAGSATLTIAAEGSSGSGLVLSVPTTNGGTPTSGSHAQSMILIAPSTAETTDDAAVTWSSTSVPTKAKPTLTTQTSAAVAAPGVRLFDTVRISGFVAGHGATGSATLYGPFASRAAMACRPATAVKTVGFTPRNGMIRTPKVRITETGYYTWVARTTSDSQNEAASHACGLKSETSLVRKPGYKSPRVDTGYTSAGDHAARSRSVKVTIPGLGVNASVSTVTAPKNVMRIPSNVAALGQLDKSAGIGDLIGATVIAGHVSDRHDRPGAFSRLGKVKKGQIVTVKTGGKTVRYRVTKVEYFSRKKTLPQRLFTTTGVHGLTLISCAGRVTTPGGGFHYSKNVVVSAERVR